MLHKLPDTMIVKPLKGRALVRPMHRSRVCNWLFMKLIGVSLLFIGLSATAGSMPDALSIPIEATSVKAFVPKGWTLEQQVQGDLNDDGIADFALVLRKKDKKNIRRSEDCANCEPVNENSRRLVMAFASAGGKNYKLATSEGVDLPTPSIDNPHIEDPYSGIAIKKGVLEIRTNFSASMGTWFSSGASFKFRYQDNCFRLIGEDSTEFMRNDLETMKSTSINYLTGKVKTETGHEKIKTTWASFPREGLKCIERVELESKH